MAGVWFGKTTPLMQVERQCAVVRQTSVPGYRFRTWANPHFIGAFSEQGLLVLPFQWTNRFLHVGLRCHGWQWRQWSCSIPLPNSSIDGSCTITWVMAGEFDVYVTLESHLEPIFPLSPRPGPFSLQEVVAWARDGDGFNGVAFPWTLLNNTPPSQPV